MTSPFWNDARVSANVGTTRRNEPRSSGDVRKSRETVPDPQETFDSTRTRRFPSVRRRSSRYLRRTDPRRLSDVQRRDASFLFLSEQPLNPLRQSLLYFPSGRQSCPTLERTFEDACDPKYERFVAVSPPAPEKRMLILGRCRCNRAFPGDPTAAPAPLPRSAHLIRVCYSKPSEIRALRKFEPVAEFLCRAGRRRP